MPELFPGSLIELEDHGIQCYVESVSHNCSYTGGFTTSVVLSAPASTEKRKKGEKDPVKQGMIRAGIFGPKATNYGGNNNGKKKKNKKVPNSSGAGQPGSNTG